MRVLLISWEYPPYVVGGIGTHVAQLAPLLGGQEMSDGPLHVDILTTRFGGGKRVEDYGEYVTVHRVDVPVMDALDWYNSVVDNNNAFVEYAIGLGLEWDLIHVHDWLTAHAGIRLKHEWKRPLVVTMHATEKGRHQGYLPTNTSQQIDRLEWRVTYEAWQVVACSDYMSEELQRYFELPAAKITVIPNGIENRSPAHCPSERLEELRNEYAPNGEKLLFFVGRIVYEKGVHFLVRAMPRILADHPNARLLVAGKNGQQLYPLAFELGVERSIDFLGYITDETRDCLYEIVDAAIFPSIYEPFGIVALEAMASNCNVIASSTGGLREVVQHGVNGLTVIPGDPMSIAWAVDQMLADPKAAKARRAVAQEQVQSIYRWDRIARLTADVYEHVAQDRNDVEW